MTTNNAVNVPLSGNTGTGNFVGSTSPTLVTPTLGAASATSLSVSNAAGITINSLAPVVTVKRQTFTSGGTYTPSTGMLYCLCQVWASGAGSGGCAQITGSNFGISGGGGGGGYAEKLVTAATIGSSQTITVGAAGLAGTAGNNAGGNGNTSSVGAIVSATGGTGGAAGATGTTGLNQGPSDGGLGSSGDYNMAGGASSHAMALQTSNIIMNSTGGSTYGNGMTMTALNGTTSAQTITFGQGAPGLWFSSTTGAATAGIAGGGGLVVITEWCNQ